MLELMEDVDISLSSTDHEQLWQCEHKIGGQHNDVHDDEQQYKEWSDHQEGLYLCQNASALAVILGVSVDLSLESRERDLGDEVGPDDSENAKAEPECVL